MYNGGYSLDCHDETNDDLSFIEDIVNIADREQTTFSSNSTLEDFSSTRYKNNWDDLDVLCSELTARETLSRKTGAAYSVEIDDFNDNRLPGVIKENPTEITDNYHHDYGESSGYIRFVDGSAEDFYKRTDENIESSTDCDYKDSSRQCQFPDALLSTVGDNDIVNNEYNDTVSLGTDLDVTSKNCDNKSSEVDNPRVCESDTGFDKCDRTETESDFDNCVNYASSNTVDLQLTSENLNSNNNNRNVFKEGGKIVLPPPRKKKMARLKAAQNLNVTRTLDNVKESSNVTHSNLCSMDSENNTIYSDSGISEGTCVELHRKSSNVSSGCESVDHPRVFSETGSKFSESLGSECEQVILSAVSEASANDWAKGKNCHSTTSEKKEKNSHENIEHVFCEPSSNDVITGEKNRSELNKTNLTSSPLVICQSEEPGCQTSARNVSQVKAATDSGELATDKIAPPGSDNGRDEIFSERCSTEADENVITNSGYSLNSESTPQDLKSDSHIFSGSDGIESGDVNSDAAFSVEYNSVVVNNTDPNAIYVHSRDFERLDGRLVVKPTNRRFSVTRGQISEDESASRKNPKVSRLRYNSTAALDRLGENRHDSYKDSVSPKTRSKSVSDLSQLQLERNPRRVKRNKSVTNRVLGAVGKFSLRVRDAFKPRITSNSQFYLDDTFDSAMSDSDRRSSCDSKSDSKHKKRSSKSKKEDRGNGIPRDRPVQTSQPADVKSVHSYPEINGRDKPKSKFRSLFGLGDKKWYTMGSIPKLFKRKSKDKYSKSDKTSSASDQDLDSVTSAPAMGGKSKIVKTRGRHKSNSRERLSREQGELYDADSLHDLPTFISLAEYRIRMEEIDYHKKLEQKQNGIGKRSRSLQYLDTSDEEEQITPRRPDHGRGARHKARPESYDEARYRRDSDQRRPSDQFDKTEKRRRYKRREKSDRPTSHDMSFVDIDKSTMAVDYGCDDYHFKGHSSLARPQSMSDLTYSSANEFYERPNHRYSNQARNRNSVAAPEDQGRRHLTKPRDRNSIAVTSAQLEHVPEKWNKDRIQRPKSMTSLVQDESPSSGDDPSVQRRKKGQRKSKTESVERRPSSPEIDPLEDAILKHLKHENGPLARRKIERKKTQDTGSLRRLKESFMAKRIWENVYDQLLQDLSKKGTKGHNSAARKALESMRQEAEEKSSSSRTDDGYYSRCSSHSSREESDKSYSRSESIEDEGIVKNSERSTKSPKKDSKHSSKHSKSKRDPEDEDDEFGTNSSVACEPLSLTLTRPNKNRRVWRPTDK